MYAPCRHRDDMSMLLFLAFKRGWRPELGSKYESAYPGVELACRGPFLYPKRPVYRWNGFPMVYWLKKSTCGHCLRYMHRPWVKMRNATSLVSKAIGGGEVVCCIKCAVVSKGEQAMHKNLRCYSPSWDPRSSARTWVVGGRGLVVSSDATPL